MTTVGVVGAGLMAGQLALLFVRRLQVPVVLTDLDQARVDKGVAYVHGEIDRLLRARGASRPTRANRLKAPGDRVDDKEAFADADLVIEAVFEELDVKKQVFAEVEAVVVRHCVLMTNTSSLSVTRDGRRASSTPSGSSASTSSTRSRCCRWSRSCGPSAPTTPTLATAFAVGKQLKKSCVLVKDAPAFVVNRLLTRFLGEVTRAVDEGTPIEVADRALAPLGPADAAVRAAAAGRPGGRAARRRDAARGLPGPVPRVGEPAAARRGRAAPASTPGTSAAGRTSTTRRRRCSCRATAPLTEEQVRERALAALAEESRLMLDEGVVAEPQDIDLCMILGAGWPFHLGGITPYLDRTGTSERATGRRFLPPGVASVPA